jgi:hypothetical protein
MRNDPATSELVKEYDQAMNVLGVMDNYKVESREDYRMIEDIQAGVSPALFLSRINKLRDEIAGLKAKLTARTPEEVEGVEL